MIMSGVIDSSKASAHDAQEPSGQARESATDAYKRKANAYERRLDKHGHLWVMRVLTHVAAWVIGWRLLSVRAGLSQ